MYKFNGKELDESTGYYYYGARYYDPAISMFLSVDPLAEKYPGINPYTYVANNPIMFIDPTGMEIVNGETVKKERLQNIKNAKARVNHVNVYDEKDPVQNKGGKGIVVSPIQSTVKGTGEYGPAKRKFDNATNISVDNPQGIGGDFHNSHNRVNDWIKKTE